MSSALADELLSAGSSSQAAAALTLLKQEPYWYDYTTFCKQRWIGRELLEVFTTEFRDRTKEYYLWAIHKGVCTVNGLKAKPRQILRNGDKIVNRVHRHEPPVTAEPIRILHRDDEKGMLVVVKPGSLPVHAAGRYYRSTLLEMIRTTHNIDPVYTVNRLDRLTSGVMVAATRKDVAHKLSMQFQSGEVRKHYICRVRGCFPGSGEEARPCTGPDTLAVPALQDRGQGTEFSCDQPIIGVDRQSSVSIVHALGKPCTTFFTRLFYDRTSNTSVVWCKPITGRTHQIRVHVQYLGHPICNDPLYGHSVWETGGRSQAELSRELISEKAWQVQGGSGSTASDKVDSVIAAIKRERDGREDWARWKDEVVYGHLLQQEEIDVPEIPGLNAGSARPSEEDSQQVLRDLGMQMDAETQTWQKRSVGPTEGAPACQFCDECKIPLQPDPSPEELFIYLHAVKYETDEWSFQDQLPWWAQRGFAPRYRPIEMDDEPSAEAAAGAANGHNSEAENGSAIGPRRRLVELPLAGNASHLDVLSCPVPLLFSTFEGLEDVAELDLRRVIDHLHPAHSHGSSATLATSYLSGRVLASEADGTSDNLLTAWQHGLVRCAAAAHLVIGEAPISKELAQSLKREKLETGRSATQLQRENERYKEIIAGEDGPEKQARLAELRARCWRKEELPPSEERLLQIIEDIWTQGEADREQALQTWKTLAGRERGAFRVTFERNGYALPTMTTAAVERELSHRAWEWLNPGTKPDDEDVAWRVNLLEPELVINFAMVPHWRSSEDPTLIELGAPGGLIISIALPPLPKPRSLQPLEARPSWQGGTPLAYHRAYLLSSLLPIPDPASCAAPKLALWDPCVGFGRIATELRAAMLTRGWESKVYGSDVDEESIQRAEKVAALCRLTSDEMQVRVADSCSIADVQSFVGEEASLDGVVTDLPWGQRVLKSSMLKKLYKDLLTSIHRMLKLGAHAILLTAEPKRLLNCIAQHQHDMQKEGQSTCLQLQPLVLQGTDGLSAEAHDLATRRTLAAEGVRPGKSGFSVGVFDLKKVDML